MKTVSFVVAFLALVCGVAVGWMIHPSEPAPSQRVEKEKNVSGSSGKVKDIGTDSARDALRRRIKELEQALTAAKAEIPQAKEKEAPSNNVDQVQAPRRHGFPTPAEMRAHIDQMRKNDPVRYARMTNGIARFRASGLRRAENRLETLAAVDTSQMSKQELEIHQRLQDVIVREQELHETFNPQNEDITDEQRTAAWQEIRSLMREKRELESAERDILLSHTAKSYGLSGDSAKEMVETVKAIYQATQSDFGSGRGFGRRGGRR